MRARGVLLAAAICLLLPGAAGCWSNYELEQQALVTALGVDRGSAGRFLASAQIVVPRAAGTQRAAGGGEREESPVFVAGAEGRTVAEAVSMLSNTTGRDLNFAFLELIVIGRDLAAEGIAPVTDWVGRSRELRLRTLLGVADGTAREVIESPGAGLDRIPGTYLASAVAVSALNNSRIVRTSVFDFLHDISLKGREPLAMRITVSQTGGKKQARISGCAVFRGYRLAGWLNETESRGYLWVTGKIGRGTVSGSLPGGKPAAYAIRGSKTKIAVDLTGEGPAFRVKITFKSNLGEVDDPDLKLERPQDLEKLEPLLAEAVAREAEAALARARALNADIFGLGEALRRRYPAQWQEIGDGWDDLFGRVPVTVEVEASIRRTEKAGSPVRPKG